MAPATEINLQQHHGMWQTRHIHVCLPRCGEQPSTKYEIKDVHLHLQIELACSHGHG